MEDPTLGSWYVENKILSRTSVVIVGTLVYHRVWLAVAVGELGASLCS
jgi:hypothetical protein